MDNTYELGGGDQTFTAPSPEDYGFTFIYGDTLTLAAGGTSSGSDTLTGSDTQHSHLFGDVGSVIGPDVTVTGNDVLNAGAAGGSLTGDCMYVQSEETEQVGGPTTTFIQGNDILNSDSNGQYLAGDSAIIANNVLSRGNDQIYGNGGNDTIMGDCQAVLASSVAIGHDYIDGGAGDDFIVGDSLFVYVNASSTGRDIIVGGEGNDMIWGDSMAYDPTSTVGGSDTFVFNFLAQTTAVTTVTTHTETFGDWLSQSGLQAASLTQSQFSTQYGAWLNHLVASYADEGLGADTNGDGVISVGLNQNSATGLPTIEGLTAAQVDAFFSDTQSVTVKTGKTSQTRYYSDDFTVETTTTVNVLSGVSSQDGHDWIMDFTAGSDRLRFQSDAFTSVDPAQYFSVEVGNFNGDGLLDTRIVLASEASLAQEDRTWSVSLSGVDLGGQALQDYVVFGPTWTVYDFPMS